MERVADLHRRYDDGGMDLDTFDELKAELMAQMVIDDFRPAAAGRLSECSSNPPSKSETIPCSTRSCASSAASVRARRTAVRPR